MLGKKPWTKANRDLTAMFWPTLLLLAVCLTLVPATAGFAQVLPTVATESSQEPDTLPSQLFGSLSAAERRDLLARLDDAQVRQLLIDFLDTRSSGVGAGRESDMVSNFEGELHVFRQRLADALHATPRFPGLVADFIEYVTPPGRGSEYLLVLLAGLAFIFSAGYLVELGFHHLSRRVRSEVLNAKPKTIFAKAGYLLLQVMFDLVAIGIFALVALACFFALNQGHPPVRVLILSMVGAAVVARVIMVFACFLLAPDLPFLRCCPISDRFARRLHAQLLCLAAFTFLFAIGDLLLAYDMDRDLRALFNLVVGFTFSAMLIVFVWRDRREVAALISGTAEPKTVAGRILAVFAQTWHLLATLYVVAIFVSAVVAGLSGHPVGIAGGIGSFLIVVAVPLIDYSLRRFIEDSVTPQSATYGYLPILFRAIRVLLVILALLIFARLWGIDIFALSSGGIGAVVIRAVVEIGLTVLLAYVAWEVARHAIDRRIKEDGGEGKVESDGEGGGTGVSRLATLLPLLRKFLFITILVMAVMVVLSALGVNVGPLLAGAGVVGIAIGFGAQTLVKDVVSGVFFLVDDAFRIGEYVDIGDVKGTVEAINVRSLVLRHHRGPLHTVPFGEIKYLTNYSRDWVIMKLEFRVTYDTDINKVKKIFKTIGADLMNDEMLGPGFIEPLKSQGVKAMEDSAMILRAKFKAKPGEQFMIRKEVYRRVQEAFKENGIEFAHRRVQVDIPPTVSDDPQVRKRIEDAAAATLADNSGQPQGA